MLICVHLAYSFPATYRDPSPSRSFLPPEPEHTIFSASSIHRFMQSSRVLQPGGIPLWLTPESQWLVSLLCCCLRNDSHTDRGVEHVRTGSPPPPRFYVDSRWRITVKVFSVYLKLDFNSRNPDKIPEIFSAENTNQERCQFLRRSQVCPPLIRGILLEFRKINGE